ncbi:MAG: DNA polymerase V, partial [Myxococcota bacterium]
HRELRGIPCLALEHTPPPRQTMVHSRSFPGTVTTLEPLQESTASFAASLGAKLRRHGLSTTWLRVFLVPPRRSEQSGRGISGSLPWPTADTRALITLTHRLLDRIWEPGFPCGKAGVMALELSPQKRAQQSLLSKPPDPAVMAVLDAVNGKLGRGTVRLAAEGSARGWSGRSSMRSQCYTTRWDELPVIGGGSLR